MSPKNKVQEPVKTERKTLTIPKEVYDKLCYWKGGEQRGISFGEAIDRLLEHSKATGYESALVNPGK